MILFDGKRPFTFCVSSGALGWDGGGWWWERPLRWAGVFDPRDFVVVAKTVTVLPRAGNLRMHRPWTCVRPLGGRNTANAVGLTNPGVDAWLKKYLPRARALHVPVVPSVKPETPHDAFTFGYKLRGHNFPFVEVNLSCPNVEGRPTAWAVDMLRELRACRHPLVLKLSLDQVRRDFVAAVDPYVDAYHAINAVPWDSVYPTRRSPLAGYAHGLKGGVSGPAIRDHAVAAVAHLGTLTAKPVVGGGGIFTTDDVRAFRDAGASAYSFGTCFLYRPWRPNRIVAEFCRPRAREFGRAAASC